MNDTTTPHKMTGGPLDPAAAAELSALRKLIAAERDVVNVHAVEPLGNGRFLYLVGTPYVYPSFAIGTTNADNSVVRILKTFGASWSAQEAWDEYLRDGVDGQEAGR